MTVFTFTPAKFTALLATSLLAAALAVGAGTSANSHPRSTSARLELSRLSLLGGAGQDNGPLTATFYGELASTPLTRSRGRQTISGDSPAPQPTIRRNYPPLAR